MLVAGMAFGQTSADLGLLKHSSFEVPEGARDPFWPIGWQKPLSEPSAALPGGAAHVDYGPRADAFVVSSISLDRIPLAVINGKPYGEGDTIVLAVGEKKNVLVKVQVFAIRDGMVTLRYQDKNLLCPLRLWQKPAKSAK
jgi:hypothetical protein